MKKKGVIQSQVFQNNIQKQFFQVEKERYAQKLE